MCPAPHADTLATRAAVAATEARVRKSEASNRTSLRCYGSALALAMLDRAAVLRILRNDLEQHVVKGAPFGVRQRLQGPFDAEQNLGQHRTVAPTPPRRGVDIDAPPVIDVARSGDVPLFFEVVEKPGDASRVLGQRHRQLRLVALSGPHQE